MTDLISTPPSPASPTGSQIAVGHCVIVNECDRCSGRMLCVITSIKAGIVYCKYLNAESHFDGFNMYLGIRAKFQDQITPIEQFGIRVCYEQEPDGGDLVYWCSIVGDSQATYHDGRPRQWQEHGWQGRYVARPKVFALAVQKDGA